ncbi:24586_t:CDS:2, partial [Racocetra persica]
MIATKETAIEFCTKRISLANIRPEILDEIHKFPFTLQKLIAKEVHVIAKRLEEGKGLPNLAKKLSKIFEEKSIEVYQTHGIVEIPVIQVFAANKIAEKNHSKINELFERTRDYYYKLAEKRVYE